MVDGERRRRVKSEDEARAWVREYRSEHAEDNPDATHVQIRRLSPWAWLTGGSLAPTERFLA
jgi:hypothetical protein